MSPSLLAGVALSSALACPVLAQSRPLSWDQPVAPLAALPVIEVEGPDRKALRLEDLGRYARGLAPRYAVPRQVSLSPERDGTWEDLPDGRLLWRVRVHARGAANLSFGATRAHLPPGAQVWLLDAHGEDHRSRPLTAEHVSRGELWSPVVRTEELVIEVVLPQARRDELVLEIERILVGYKSFGDSGLELGFLDLPPSGACNNDVICPEGDPWRDEIASVAVYGTGGGLFCTGGMVNNTREDQTPYFLTAYHCGITSGNANRIVVYWNFESPECGRQGGGSLDDFQTGATFRAGNSSSDFTLLELDDMPAEGWGVTWAGWDSSGDDASSAVGIHHPSTDEKAISFENQPTSHTSYSGNNSPGDGTHVRVSDWDDGTTEGGSSGSPLFNQDHRIIGQLHGGSASCSNNESDWYGAFDYSWDRGGNSSSRLRDWLDPDSTGAETLDTLTGGGSGPTSGVLIDPDGDQVISGDVGGPWSPGEATWTVQNTGDGPVDVNVTIDAEWVDLNRSSGTLSSGQTLAFTFEPNAVADGLPAGAYTGTVIVDADGVGTSAYDLTLQVGEAEVVYEWDMSEDPGWTLQGAWEWGVPTGDGGKYGSPDPSSGYTGNRVLGYNLSGDYENGLSPKHATLGPIDASDLSGVTLAFQRWLGVEESKYDHAKVAVSTDNSDWTVVWENSATIEDSSWSYQELNIAELADGAPQVWIRWTMGSTDGSWTYCGWNLDDVQILAVVDGGGTGTGDGGAGGSDTGSSAVDTGTGGPSGDGPDDEDDDRGQSITICGCSAGAAAGPWLVGLLPLLALRRRRVRSA